MTALLVLCLMSELPGSLDIDPRLSWYTLETDHFAVHFSSLGRLDARTESLARHVADLAEEVHSQLTALIGWTPKPRTQIVIADFADYSNGWAAPLPDNTITIIPTPPAGERTNYDDWLRTLLAHEYAHVVQVDMARGGLKALRNVFGRAVLPNALQPVWLLEGYALQTETRSVGFGRARSPEYDMMIRAAADAGTLLPIDRCCNYELERWPEGNAPYLYGGLFLKHLAGESGPNVWDRYSLAHSGGIPYFDNLFAGRVFGASFNRLWRKWQAELTGYSDSARRAISAEPLTPLRRLTFEGASTSSPLWSRSGREVYFLSRNGTEYPAIKAIDTATGRIRVLYRGRVMGNLSLSPDGRRLAFAEFVLTNHYDESDVFCLNLYSGELKRLTRGMRARDPDYSPDSSSLVFVGNHDGRNDLMLMNLASGGIENLTETEDYSGYSSPRFSPDGRYIAVAANHPAGYADIEIIDRKTGWTVPVTEDLANDLSPCWSRTGKHLFFISDRSGVFNLYAYSHETREIRRSTNVLYGAFEPAVSPDNHTIALVSHGPEGDDVGITALDSRIWQPAHPFTDTLRAQPLFPDSWERLPSRDAGPVIPSEASPSRGISPALDHSTAGPLRASLYYYNPFPTVLPKLWLPLVWRDSDWLFGAFTFGWDALQFHRYTAAAGYRTGAGPFLALDYRLSRFRPLAGLSLDLDPELQTGAISLDVPFLTNRRSSQLGFSAQARYDTLLSSRYTLGFATSTALGYRFDVAPVQGALYGTYAGLESRNVLGRRDRTRVAVYFTQFLGRPLLSRSPSSAPLAPGSLRDWSLRLRIVAGTAFGDSSRNSAWSSYPADGALGVRGFSTGSDPGRSILDCGAQFRFPLCWPERGISTAPFFLRNLNAALFADWAMVWNQLQPQSTDWRESRLGIGAELRTDFVVVHLVPASISVGYARGLLPEGGNQLYVRLESSLLEELLARPDPDRFDPVFLRN